MNDNYIMTALGLQFERLFGGIAPPAGPVRIDGVLLRNADLELSDDEPINGARIQNYPATNTGD